RSGFLVGNQGGDLADRVEVFYAGLVRLDSNLKTLFEEDDELESANRIEDTAGNQGRGDGQFAGILAGKKLVQDEMMNDLGNFFHDSLESLPRPGRLSPTTIGRMRRFTAWLRYPRE